MSKKMFQSTTLTGPWSRLPGLPYFLSSLPPSPSGTILVLIYLSFFKIISYLAYLFILLIFTAQSATILVLILPLTARFSLLISSHLTAQFVNMFQCTGSDRWTPARGDTTASIGVRSHERKRKRESDLMREKECEGDPMREKE